MRLNFFGMVSFWLLKSLDTLKDSQIKDSLSKKLNFSAKIRFLNHPLCIL